MPRGISLLQLSDVHFGARLGGGRLGLSEDGARRREEERREAFTRAIALVSDRDLDGVLIPGDLFDDESVSADTLRFVMHQLGSLAPKPVFLAPGNHDPFGGTSPYNLSAPEAARGLAWPDNVVLFAHEDFRTYPWPGRDDVAVTACGVAADVPSDQRRLAQPIGRPEAALSLLLFHGSRDDDHWLQANKATCPFSREELLAQEFDWTALGHYHDRQVLADDTGVPRAAYSGCALAGRLDETGAKGALIVRLEPGGVPTVETVILDPRQIRHVEVDLTGSAYREDALHRVESALHTAGARPDDLVLLELIGRRMAGLDLGFLEGLTERIFHLRADMSRLVPDVDLSEYPELARAETTEQRFVAHLKAHLQSEDLERAGLARRALLYGLDAIHAGRIEARYEE